MISLNFGLFWCGAKLTYLRYLTFKTLRHFHPHSRIQLFVSSKFDTKNKGTGKGGSEELEFADPNFETVDYMPKLKELDVEVIRFDRYNSMGCNHQSDMFRWWFLANNDLNSNGSFYLDTDQIILRSFKALPLNYKFIYTSYNVEPIGGSSQLYSPVGVLGATSDSRVVRYIASNLLGYFKPDSYECIGPHAFGKICKMIDMSEGFNAPPQYFYPTIYVDRVSSIYNGSLEIKDDNYSLHWFGGWHESQIFNKSYTPEKAKIGSDTISQFLRRNKLL